MEKISVIEYTERWGTGGVEAYITHLVCGLDRERYDVRVLTAQKESKLFETLLEHDKGISVHALLPDVVPSPIERVIKTIPEFKKYIQENPCDILHLHISHGLALSYAKAAKKAGAKKVIAHSHNSSFKGRHVLMKLLAHQYGKYAYRRYIDNRIACSENAAKWLFTHKDLKSVKKCKSFVDVNKFRFSPADRDSMRKQCGLTDEIIYLTVGRINYQKNPEFLLKVFYELAKLNATCRLVWIGTGESSDQIYRLAEEWMLSQRIFFVESTLEVEKYMSMADVFLLPSLFEGNPIVVTEAQTSGLPCYLSDCITEQAKLLDTTKFISLRNTAKEWAVKIHNGRMNSLQDRKVCADKVKEKGYEIERQINDIEQVYCEGMQG